MKKLKIKIVDFIKGSNLIQRQEDSIKGMRKLRFREGYAVSFFILYPEPFNKADQKLKEVLYEHFSECNVNVVSGIVGALVNVNIILK